tara:strand:- start:170 stop:364 length:195 start_codon:yes stop_codon:yes gene_type:complete
MAVGEFAQPMYELLDDLGGDQSVEALNLLLDNLTRWMSGSDIEEFVENFRRMYEMDDEDSEEEY